MSAHSKHWICANDLNWPPGLHIYISNSSHLTAVSPPMARKAALKIATSLSLLWCDSFSSTSSFEISESLVQKAQASREPEYLFFYLWTHLILTSSLGHTIMSILQERKQVPRSERSCSIHPTNKWHCLPIALLIQVVYSFHHIMPPCLTLFSKHCSYSIDVIAAFSGENERGVAEREIDRAVGGWVVKVYKVP